MTLVHDAVSGRPVSVWLAQEIQTVRRHLETARHRAARTLIRTPHLHVVLVAIREGGEVSEHTAEGPITIHVLDGCIELYVQGRRHTLGAGMLMSLEGGVSHSVASGEGGLFLLTVLNLPQPIAGRTTPVRLERPA
ncbi:MAG: cupin domain-containing protein [Gemmatimonadaceae bacterium]